MSLKFCANLGFLFLEKANVIERYAAAGIAGFRGVEGPFPAGYTVAEVVDAANTAGIQQILVNIKTGDVPNGQFGVASFPNQEKAFQDNFDTTLELAKALNCKKIHVMAGKLSEPPTAENDAAYITNLRYVATKLTNEDVIAVIEPINGYSVPGYYLNSYQKAIKVIDTINSPKIKLMLDLFHLQLIQGNISNTILEVSNYIGHVQIAQAPHRNEPDTDGEVNFPFVLKRLIAEGYTDWVGCEYVPKNGTVHGLNWIKNFGFEL